MAKNGRKKSSCVKGNNNSTSASNTVLNAAHFVQARVLIVLFRHRFTFQRQKALFRYIDFHSTLTLQMLGVVKTSLGLNRSPRCPFRLSNASRPILSFKDPFLCRGEKLAQPKMNAQWNMPRACNLIVTVAFKIRERISLAVSHLKVKF